MKLKSIIELVSKEKKLSKEIVANAVKVSLEKVAGKKYPFGRIEAEFDKDFSFKIMHYKQVVDSEPEMLDEESEVNLIEATELYGDVSIGDEIGFEITDNLGRVDATFAKQIIGDLFKVEESAVGFKQFKDKKGTIISGTVQNFDKKGTLVSFGAVEGFLPRAEMLRGEKFRRNDPIEVLLEDVSLENGRLKMQLSRTSSEFVVELLKEEIDEVRSGEIEIVSCIRAPREKTKVVIQSSSMSNPVAACIGSQGIKIKKVMARMGGERVDFSKYSDDLLELMSGLFAPAKIRHVEETDREIKLDVLSEDLGKAIGKDGVNIRLATVMLGKKITVS